MRGRRAGARRRALLAALGAACVAGSATTAVAPGPAGAAPDAAASGIGATWATAQGAWAALPMGHLASANNTFWELLFRRTGTTRWTLVTPPGVATNGGVVGAATPAATGVVTVGIQPAKYLRYSPVARTTDGGKRWLSGTLPSGLAPVADAMASAPAGTVVALERGRGGTLVRSDGSLTRWTTIATGRALAATAAGRACGLRALSAVTLGSAGPEVGADCTRPGVVGLLADQGGSWVADGPRVGQEAGATMRVLRLSTVSSVTAAVVEARTGRRTSVLALWRRAGQAWTVSAPVRVEGDLVSAGFGPVAPDAAAPTAATTSTTSATSAGSGASAASTGPAVVVVTATRSGRVAVHAVPGPGARWTTVAAPKGTEAVVGPGGPADAGVGAGTTALSVSGSWVTVWSRSAGGWRRGPRLEVPIEYGSST